MPTFADPPKLLALLILVLKTKRLLENRTNSKGAFTNGALGAVCHTEIFRPTCFSD